MAEEKKEIFRKKSLERVSSPEHLNDYLHVTSPAVWVVLTSVIGYLFAVINPSFSRFAYVTIVSIRHFFDVQLDYSRNLCYNRPAK